MIYFFVGIIVVRIRRQKEGWKIAPIASFKEFVRNRRKNSFKKELMEGVRADLSCFERLDYIYKNLHGIFDPKKIELRVRTMSGDASGDNTFLDTLLDIASEIDTICLDDPDPAIGYIILDTNEYYSIRHSIHTAIICAIVSKAAGWGDDERLTVICAALSMNISMLELQDTLHFQNHELTINQKTLLKTHPEQSVEILEACGITDRQWLLAVYEHHEMPDGSGYPLGLLMDKTSTAARIVSLADIYTAQITGRDYRNPLVPSNAVKSLFLKKGKKVDDDLLVLFIQVLGIYPPGTVVRLWNNELAVVTYRGKSPNHPIVSSLPDPKVSTRRECIFRDTSEPEFGIKETIPWHISNVKVARAHVWGLGTFKGLKKDIKTKIVNTVFQIRRDRRIQTHLPFIAIYSDNSEKTKGYISDISATGCRLNIPISEKIYANQGGHLFIAFKFKERFVNRQRCIIRNMRVENGLNILGVEFGERADENGQIIESLLND